MPLLTSVLLLLASCDGESSSEPKTAEGDGERKLVQWAPPSAGLLAADRKVLDAALAPVAAEKRAPPPQGAPDIAVIVLDTVRADHLGLYGYDRETSPNLDAWAKDAHVWDNAIADSPWTLPSHASMFTGLPTRSHAARSVDAADPRKGAPLAERFTTVAERLQEAGWRTVGIAGNRAFLHPAYGLSQGFDAWLCEQLLRDPRDVPYNPADRVLPLAEAALTHESDRPLFLFVNLMDAHTPYQPRAGSVRDPSLLRSRTLPGHKGYRKASRELLKGVPIDEDITTSWSEAYDAELRWMDTQLAQFLPRLAGVEHIFILSDHGEYLGEHQLVEHGKDLYQPALHIPFIAKSSAFPAGRSDTLIQSHDLAWMILQVAGLPADPSMEATDDVAVSEQYYALKKDIENKEYGQRFNRVRRSFQVGSQKLIVGSDGSRESYDLATDPGELKDNATLDPRFDTIEAGWLAAHPEVAVVPIGEQTIPEPTDEELRALGYVE